MKFKKLLPSICTVVLALSVAYSVNANNEATPQIEENTGAITEDISNSEQTDISSTSKTTQAKYTNSATLPPIKVKFAVNINVQKNNDGKYYMHSTSFEKPIVTNIENSSFTVEENTAKRIDGGRTYMVTAKGVSSINGNYMGSTSVSAFFYLNSKTGEITASYK